MFVISLMNIAVKPLSETSCAFMTRVRKLSTEQQPVDLRDLGERPSG